MRGFFAILAFLWFFPSAALSQEQQPATFPASLSLRHVTLRVDSSRADYDLPDSLLVAGSEQVWVPGDTLEPGLDYDLDPVRGRLILKRRSPADSLVHLRYHRLPLPLPIIYRHRLPVLASEDSLEQQRRVEKLVQQTRQQPASEFASDLRKSGSLVRGVSVGTNQGLKVDSGLRMQLSGRIARDVEVIASLTDQNTPIQPEGNTQTLREIDKVFVQLKAERMQATLGDFNIGYDGTQFARYQRKLQGAMGTASIGNTEVTVSGAVSRGQFTTNTFLGQEGNQGPYQLRGERGEVDIIVLAGTERVYIDGELMTRGEDRDYVIEYGNGQITFTRNRLITADSRITVDFQYSAEHFRRNLYSARGRFQTPDQRLTLSTTLIREGDDKDNPLDFSLSEDELARLRLAGDNPDSAVVDGWRFVGQGNGTYVRNDSTGIFEYVGSGAGDYVVTFSFVGPGQGDYVFEGFGRFRYVGEGLGSYAPVIFLSPAQSHTLADFNLTLQPTPDLQLDAEIASSLFDANLYSSRDDGDNRGLATQFRLAYQPQRLRVGGRSLGSLRLGARYRRKNSRFRDIDRTTIIEYGRQWDLPADLRSSEETVTEVETAYEPARGFSFRGGLGRLLKTGDFRSHRWEVQTLVDRKGLPQLDYRVENIDRRDRRLGNRGQWLRQRGKVSVGLGRLRPFVNYEGEVKKETVADSLQSGFRFSDVSTGVELSRWHNLSLFVQVGLRDDDLRAGRGFEDRSVATTRQIRLQLHELGALSADLGFTHRSRDFADPALSSSRTDLADARITFSPFGRALVSQWHYQINNTRVARQERVFIKVTEGQGNYRFDPNFNEYVPDPFGDHILRVFATDDFIPVVEVRAGTNVRFEPGRLLSAGGKSDSGWWRRALAPISLESLIRVEEKTREPDVWRIYRLDLGAFQRESTTLLGQIEWRQDLYLWRNRRDRSIRLRYELRRDMNNQFLEGGQRQRRSQISARVNLRLARRFWGQFDLVRRLQERRFSSALRADRDIVSTQGVFDVSYRPRPPLELALRSTVGVDRDREPDPATEVLLLEVAPRLSYALNRQGRLRAEVSWIDVSSEPANRFIPFEMAGGRRVGTTTTWNLSFNYRFSTNLMATLSYNGRKEPGRSEILHVGRAEIRAFF